MLQPYGNKSEKNNEDDSLNISPDKFSKDIAESQAEAETIIKTAEEELKTLNEMKWKLKYTTPILLLAILLNLGFMLIFTWQYFLYWIMSSFIFLMINPFLLMIPTNTDDIKSYINYFRNLRKHEKNSLEEIESLNNAEKKEHNIAEKKEMIKNLSKQRKFLSELGWNLFFINCQPLAPGFLVLFALSSVFALAGWLISGQFNEYSSIIVIVQSFAIIVFYLAIVYVQPYSNGFFVGMLGMHSRFKKRYEISWSQGLKYALAAAVLIIGTGLIFIAAILLPGFTYNRFITVELDIQVQAGIFVLIFIMQVIFVRHLQGKYSRILIKSVIKSKIEMTRTEIIPEISKLKVKSLKDGVTLDMEESLENIKTEIARHQVVKTGYISFFGYFPIFMINPDIKVIISIAKNKESDTKNIQKAENTEEKTE
jgi:hypothetical protein